jgi:hypothetical protein
MTNCIETMIENTRIFKAINIEDVDSETFKNITGFECGKNYENL